MPCLALNRSQSPASICNSTVARANGWVVAISGRSLVLRADSSRLRRRRFPHHSRSKSMSAWRACLWVIVVPGEPANGSREDAQAKPLPTRPLLGIAVHMKASQCGATDRCKPNDCARRDVGVEVQFPPVAPRMKKSRHPSSFWIGIIQADAFMNIAGTTGKGQIRFGICTISRQRHDMLHLERQVEHKFGCMAVLAAM